MTPSVCRTKSARVCHIRKIRVCRLRSGVILDIISPVGQIRVNVIMEGPLPFALAFVCGVLPTVSPSWEFSVF